MPIPPACPGRHVPTVFYVDSKRRVVGPLCMHVPTLLCREPCHFLLPGYQHDPYETRYSLIVVCTTCLEASSTDTQQEHNCVRGVRQGVLSTLIATPLPCWSCTRPGRMLHGDLGSSASNSGRTRLRGDSDPVGFCSTCWATGPPVLFAGRCPLSSEAYMTSRLVSSCAAHLTLL